MTNNAMQGVGDTGVSGLYGNMRGQGEQRENIAARKGGNRDGV